MCIGRFICRCNDFDFDSKRTLQEKMEVLS